MSQRIRLILTLHNHQPIGNFDGVFEEAYRDSYAPFLELLEEFPEIPVVLHNSGCLLEWLVEEHPEYVDRLRALVQRGQVELLGGPFYEPILAGIPRRDRVGQISLYRRFLEKTFGTKIRGMWMPERVWEQGFTADIAAAGIEYTLLDDMHFRNAGLSDEQLHGYHLTEDDGQLLKVFAGSERLRYLIPYADPEKVIAHVREVAILITAREMDSQFEWVAHEPEALKEGVEPAVIDAIKHRTSTAGLNETDATVIELGRQIFRDHKVKSETFAKAKALFGPAKLVELVMLMGNYAGTAALLTLVNMQLHTGKKPLLPIP